MQVGFSVDDLTDLRHVSSTFDLLVDYGTLDDLRPKDRDLYMENVLPLTHLGSTFLLYAFEWPFRWWERLLFRITFFGAMALEPGEVERRFGKHFEIDRFAGRLGFSSWPPGDAVYVMTRVRQLVTALSLSGADRRRRDRIRSLRRQRRGNLRATELFRIELRTIPSICLHHARSRFLPSGLTGRVLHPIISHAEQDHPGACHRAAVGRLKG